ncbi:uncharacterized protein LOC125651596 [Ostrea edulis]|uniref:uncharacterized protein LOC125651596 n=1 Tax=Ostrea edulis TaxID=37623 RepID=UPI0020956D21|nr:uncharacterized protein LOC125651596 [Ostrea edulis]
MHAVYAGGSTPTPSPRVHRKQFGYGRPVMPGYSFPHKQSPLHHKSASKDSDDSSSKETNFRESIPAMCTAVAFTCLICNILVPGLGTFLAGLSVLCGSKMRLKDNTKSKVVLVNCWVAFLQLFTTIFFLLGWIWSIVWGTLFLSYSDEFYKIKETDNEKREPDKTEEQRVKPPASPAKQRDNTHTNASHKPPTNAHVQRIPVQQIQHEIPSTSSSDHQIITLQELPTINNEDGVTRSDQPIMNARTRHQKILRRQMSDHDLSPFSLTQEQLEDIIIHAAPVTRANRMTIDEANEANPEKG